MRIVANESQIRNRTKLGERAPFVGLIVLAASVVLLFVRPDLIWATMILVWVGFVVSMIGSYLGERYVGPLAHHKRVPEILKGLDNNYALLLYRLPVPCVLMEPGGLTVLTLKAQGGDIRYENGRWRHRQKMGVLRRFLGQETVGRPNRMAEAERDIVANALAKRLPEGVEIPVRSLVLFTNPDVQLDVDEDAAPVPAVRGAEAKRWLRKNALRPQLSADKRAALQAALGIDEDSESGT